MFKIVSRSLLFFLFAIAVSLSSCKEDEVIIPDPEPDDGSTKGTIYEPTTFSNISADPNVADYYITGILSVESELTIDSGVVIEMGPSAGIVVKTQGTIMALGAPGYPITITGKSKSRGFWNYIMVNSTDPRNELRYVNIEYGGGDASNNGTVFLNSGGVLSMKNCSITNSKKYALVAMGENSTLNDFSDNVIENNESPVKIRPNQIPSIGNNTIFNNNDSSYITIIGSNIITPLTWDKKSIPYLFRGNTSIESDVIINAGIDITFDYGSSIIIKQTGSLKAIGTSSEKINLKSCQDIPGYWNGIVYQSRSNNNELSNVNIQYAGGSPIYMGAIYVGGPISYPDVFLKMSQCNITSSASWGVYVQQNTEFINGGGNNFSNNIFGNVGP
ncbi:MAG: hypothetical protein PHT69_14820 [Bacteroidales bacterium]|nr:hypothetical protein [Bacteroidales bacterium]